ncbi:hypothetical protein ACOMHN_007553 [Nucella lapillus]
MVAVVDDITEGGGELRRNRRHLQLQPALRPAVELRHHISPELRLGEVGCKPQLHQRFQSTDSPAADVPEQGDHDSSTKPGPLYAPTRPSTQPQSPPPPQAQQGPPGQPAATYHTQSGRPVNRPARYR